MPVPAGAEALVRDALRAERQRNGRRGALIRLFGVSTFVALDWSRVCFLGCRVGILVSAETRQRVGAGIAFTAAEPMHVRGRTQPLQTFVPTGLGARTDAPRPTGPSSIESR